MSGRARRLVAAGSLLAVACGNPLPVVETAADVAFSLEALREEQVPVSYWPTARNLVVGATALDKHRVRFEFTGLLAPRLRLEALSFPIVPRHILGNPAERVADPTLRSSVYYNRYGREAVIGSGPFRFVEWRSNDRLVLERWEDHYLFDLAPPAAKTMIFKFQPDRNLTFLQFLSGEYDQTYVDANIFARQAVGPLFEERGVKASRASALLLNVIWNQDGSNPFFGDPRVRRALAHAYDADTVLRRVGHGLYRRSYGYTPSTTNSPPTPTRAAATTAAIRIRASTSSSNSGSASRIARSVP